MDNEYKKALREVFEVLNNTDKEVVEKIPEDFMTFLQENMDKEYKPSINFGEQDWENTLKDEAQAMLAAIYRDYVCEDEEREELLEEEKKEKIKRDKELMEKYDPFKNSTKNKEEQIETENKEAEKPVEIKKETWYKKIYNKILNIFGIKH